MKPDLSENKRPICLILFCIAAIWVAGCEIEPRTESTSDIVVNGLAGSGDYSSCLDWKWIAKFPAGTPCPNVNNWTARKMFINQGSSYFDGFCEYKHLQVVVPSVDITNLESAMISNGAVTWDRDCMVVHQLGLVPVGGPYDFVGKYGSHLQAEWLEQVDEVNHVERDSSLPQTRLAILDTSPTMGLSSKPEEVEGESDHAYVLANLAKDLVCGSSGHCVADLTTQEALPYTKSEPGGNQGIAGGFVGTIGDFSEAVVREIEDWRSAVNHTPNLVLNASVGWDLRFSEHEGDVRAATDAAYRSLELASCLGALTVASAGNRVFDPNDIDLPLAPGYWESNAAPDYYKCLQIADGQYDINNSDFPSGGRPLVFSVSGIGSLGEDLSNAVSDWMPPLSSYSDHVVTIGRADHKPTSVLTGSSVAAINVSSIAASVWHYLPGLNAKEVMDYIWQGGEYIQGGVGADYYMDYEHGASAPARKRATMCSALEAACGAYPPGTGNCPNSGGGFYCETWDQDLTELPWASDTLPSIKVVNNGYDSPYYRYDSIFLTPEVRPQPEYPVCPTCVAMLNSHTFIAILPPEDYDFYSADAWVTVNGEEFKLQASHDEMLEGFKVESSRMPFMAGDEMILWLNVEGILFHSPIKINRRPKL